MTRPIRLGGLAMAVVLVLSAATPALASQPADIEVTVDDPTYTITVTYNDSATENASVTVDPTDPNASYAGGSAVTDANGTATFDLPGNETTVNISASFDGHDVATVYTLPGTNETATNWDGEGPFGQWLTSVLRNLVPAEMDVPFGQFVSDIARSNIPGNGQGPPEHAGPSGDDVASDEGARGPPERTGDEGPDVDDTDDLNVTVDGEVEAGATVTGIVSHNGSAVENATVKLNGEVVGTTDADGQLAVTLPEDLGDEIEIVAATEDAEGEWEHEFEDDEEDDGDEEAGETDADEG